MKFISPLRYPGGKGKLGPYFARLLASQSVSISSYAEPYAGGAGAGLFLLSEGHIEHLYINDLNPGIAAFWRFATQCSDEFAERIQGEEVTLDSWHRHREIYLSPAGRPDAELGFSTFFMNRCNRSGILSARPIGGLDQSGKWKIDARFNRHNLAQRVLAIGKMADRIEVTCKPALDFIAALARESAAILHYVDPPYVVQGEELYMSVHSWPDHERLASALNQSRHPWVLTYDVSDRVRALYEKSRCLSYSISHTAQSRRVGQEYMLFSRGVRVSDKIVAAGREGTWMS